MSKLFIIKRIIHFIGTKGSVFFCISIFSSAIISVIEYAVAIFLMILLFSFGFINFNQLPVWLPFDVRNISPIFLWASLFIIALLRAIVYITTYQAKIMFTEGTHSRFRLILAYKMLISGKGINTMPLSRINFYMSEIFPKATNFLFHLTQLMSFIVQAIMISIGMFYLAWQETILGLVGISLMGLLVLKFNRITNRIARTIPEAQADLEKSKIRISRNWLLIKILRIQDKEYKKFLDSIFQYYHHSTLAYFFGNLGGAIMPVLGSILFAAIVLGNFYFFKTPAVNLVAFIYLFFRFQQMIASGSNMLGSVFIYNTQLVESVKILSTLSPDEIKSAFKPENHFKLKNKNFNQNKILYPKRNYRTFDPSHSSPPASIQFKEVSFKWPDMAEPVFSNLSLKIKAGSQFGLIGPNGCGKSTILGLIADVLQPSKGQILINKKPCGSGIKSYWNNIAYVGPEPYLIYGSIRDNLTYGTNHIINDQELFKALAMVNLNNFISSLHGGFGYIIKENGDGLSAGQKQCLTLARAFLRKPALMILDEPSANLDDSTESAIVKALEQFKGNCTVIIVSHKPGILKGADTIFDLGEFTK